MGTKMEAKIISREYIKPSSPTPLHLKTYELSFLDQIRRHSYFPMLLYYSYSVIINPNDFDCIISKRSISLRQSLSETLTRFYPFAGKLKEKILSVDCNDDGIYLVEARVQSPLNELLEQPDLSSLNKLLPAEASELVKSDAGIHVAKIQVTTFACGGLVICACLSHLFGDATTLTSFLKNWAAAMACKTNSIQNQAAIVYPTNGASFLFPQNHAFPMKITATQFVKTGRFVTRRFVFDARAIATLKVMATSSSVRNPTRVEAVSAILSKSIMHVAGHHNKPMLLTHLVNLRSRANPPLSVDCMGNILWIANAMISSPSTMTMDGLVCQLREAIMKISGDFVKGLQGDGGFQNFCEAVKGEIEDSAGAGNRVRFTSWCKFGFYDIDFGWGRPVWISSVGLDETCTEFFNVVILMDTRSGDGIEAWVYLLEDEMIVLENDKELLTFASLDPSPLAHV